MWLCPDFDPDQSPYVINTTYKRVVDLNRDGFTGTITGQSGQFVGFRGSLVLLKKNDII